MIINNNLIDLIILQISQIIIKLNIKYLVFKTHNTNACINAYPIRRAFSNLKNDKSFYIITYNIQ